MRFILFMLSGVRKLYTRVGGIFLQNFCLRCVCFSGIIKFKITKLRKYFMFSHDVGENLNILITQNIFKDTKMQILW